MKYIAIITVSLLSACASSDQERQLQLQAEANFHSEQAYPEGIYSKYDPEYVDDCFYYEELVCEFE